MVPDPIRIFVTLQRMLRDESNAYPEWDTISLNAHHFNTIFIKDFENLMAYM
jgi:hypothetical protein